MERLERKRRRRGGLETAGFGFEFRTGPTPAAPFNLLLKFTFIIMAVLSVLRPAKSWIHQFSSRHRLKLHCKSLDRAPAKGTTVCLTTHQINSATQPPARPRIRRDRPRLWSSLESSEAPFVANETAVSVSTPLDLRAIDTYNGLQLPSTSTVENWRLHPALNIEYKLATWVVPKQYCHAVLCEPQLQSLLASRFFDELPLQQPTPKLVRSFNETHQLVLRNRFSDNKKGAPCTTETLQWLDDHGIEDGPAYTIHLEPRHFTTAYIFETIGISPLTSFEQVGHVIHLNLKEHHLPFRHVIGEVLLESLGPTVQTVVNKIGEVQGDYRTYAMEVLAGENSTKVKVNERGASLEFDLSKVYWSSRLAGERKVLMREILQDVARKDDTVVIADAFCGVGALCVLLAQTNLNSSFGAADSKIRVLANDWNPDAIEALENNVKRNRVAPFVDFRCGDAYDFLMDLGLSSDQLPHHVIMNYPLEAPTFLNVLRWWKVPKRKADVVPRIHVYTFARRQGDRSATDVAVDEVAYQLLPEGNKPTPGRLYYLQSLNCDVKVREVRDVAPGKLVVCVSFRATALLLRHVQGDFV